jgi:hypothetical protein
MPKFPSYKIEKKTWNPAAMLKRVSFFFAIFGIVATYIFGKARKFLEN